MLTFGIKFSKGLSKKEITEIKDELQEVVILVLEGHELYFDSGGIDYEITNKIKS